MCGIFAYVGKKEALPLLLEGLTSLEYRGYDSAGVFVPGAGFSKSSGAVENLIKKLEGEKLPGTSGIAHLRWATHGEPTERNAHPHVSCDGQVALVHNGIIENHKELREKLERAGHRFSSDTDTETLPHLIEEMMKARPSSFEEAVLRALGEVRGTYGLAISYAKEPGKIIAARMGAPIVLGVGEGERFVASDASPILSHTKNVVYLGDGQIAVLEAHRHAVKTFAGEAIELPIDTIAWDAAEIQKGGYEHFMMKEIMEQPNVLRDALRGRLDAEKGIVVLSELDALRDRLQGAERIVLVACGTAYHAALVGEYLLERLAGIPVDVEAASEFRYRRPVITPKTVLIAVSQSGETADTLEAIREAKRQGALTLAIVNVVGSTIAREVDARMYTHAGPEIGVASTKAYVAQVACLSLLSLFLARGELLSEADRIVLGKELSQLPEKVTQILGQNDLIKELAAEYSDARDFLYIGRTYNFPTAYEGALKLKEISYIHAEGCGAGEMKHGPLAMIDEQFPTVAVALQDQVYEKMCSNIQEIRARKGPVIAVATEGDSVLKNYANHVIYIPRVHELLSPILAVVPLQLFAYHLATLLGRNVDRPRNLAKSVTVE